MEEHYPNCVCEKSCLCCTAENLAVSVGCEAEAKQYEYNLPEKLSHKEHAGPPARAGKLSHVDHETAMASPAMAKEMEADMRRRFLISFALSIIIFLYSPVAMNFGIKLPSPIPVNWILFILTSPVVFWTGSIFLTGTYYSLKNKALNMSVLIATGVLAAYLFSVVLTFTIGGETFYEAAAFLVAFVLFGHWMEMKSRRGTSEALRALFDLVPPKAKVIRGGLEVVILSSEIAPGDIVVLRPGDKVPVDGEIIEGESAIDESLVTGESVPVSKTIGGKVVGGSVNQTGLIKFKATQVGSETVLAQIIKMVEVAQNSKAPGQRLADKAAAYLVVVAIAVGLFTFFGWYFIAGASFLFALTFAVSAVVVACPDALGLATPTAVAVGTGIGAKNNILIKDAVTLENTSKINAIVLDKTGTLTEGKFRVTDIIPFGGFTEEDMLNYEAGMEAGSNHPLAKAILAEAARRKVTPSRQPEKFESIAGYGLKAIIDGRVVLAGKEKLLRDNGIVVGEEEKKVIERLAGEGKTFSLLGVGGTLAGVTAAADPIKPNAKRAVRELKALGIEVAMITGDHAKVAQSVGGALGIERIFAEVLPEDKAKYVKKLQDEGKFVAMVGDGINDAPALAQADIGIAIGAGTDVAKETGNIILVKSDPYDIVAAFRLSKATVVKMKQNLFWAVFYNLLAIPVAAGVFYNSFGLSLRPEFSALLMSASSIFVALNAVSLKRIEPKLRV